MADSWRSEIDDPEPPTPQPEPDPGPKPEPDPGGPVHSHQFLGAFDLPADARS